MSGATSLFFLLLLGSASGTSDVTPSLPGRGGQLEAAPERRILRQHRSASAACAGIRCPDRSRCKALGGVPTCVCPRLFKRLRPKGTSYICSSRDLDNSDFLDNQNAARAAVGSPPLTWSDTAAAKAQLWANTVKSTLRCRAQVQMNRGGFGQNVASQEIVPGFAKRMSTMSAVGRWVRQGVNYTKLSVFNPDGASGCGTGEWGDCSTYLQVVWQYTTQVGCGYAECGSSGQVWVCNYFLPGLITGLSPFQPCYKTKCSSKQVCSADSRLRPTCTTPACISQCPKGGSCALGPSATPYCTCKGPQMAAIRDQCVGVWDPLEVVPQTSVALFLKKDFKQAPFIFRAPIPTSEDPGCVNLPKSFAKKTRSIKVVWRVGDQKTSGAKPQPCTGLIFWEGRDCFGRGKGNVFASGSPTYADNDAASSVRKAQSISCA